MSELTVGARHNDGENGRARVEEEKVRKGPPALYGNSHCSACGAV